MSEHFKPGNEPRLATPEEEMKEQRSLLLRYLDILTRDSEPGEIGPERFKDPEYERVAEYSLRDGRKLIMYFRPNNPEDRNIPHERGSVVITDRKMGGRRRHISYEYWMAGDQALVQKHETETAKGQLLTDIRSIIAGLKGPVSGKLPPVATEQNLKTLNRILALLKPENRSR